jgi:hypothetical protein
MYDMFDMNLLTQIQALDRKFSLANDKPRLKRKTSDDHKEKGSHMPDRKTVGAVVKDSDYDSPQEAENSHVNIDITV